MDVWFSENELMLLWCFFRRNCDCKFFLTLHFNCIVTGNPPRPVRQTLVGCIVQAFLLFVGSSPGRNWKSYPDGFQINR